jgi:hypothetical protein
MVSFVRNDVFRMGFPAGCFLDKRDRERKSKTEPSNFGFQTGKRYGTSRADSR